jgi:hypothetical protein
MKGRYYAISSTNKNRAYCQDCHTAFPHEDDLMNEHTIKIDCKTCHIPAYAKVNATKMYWDWSTACNLKDGNPYFESDSMGNQSYMSEKGSFVWKKNVAPEYAWFNGTADHYLLTDKIDTVPVQINTLFGSYNDRESKIIPKKVHRGLQPRDTKLNNIIQAKLWDAEKGKGALWVDFDWQKSLKAGMDYLGLPYSGQYDFVNTEMHFPVSHMVSTKENVVSCNECHTRNESRLAGLDDFYMPGRDRNNTVDLLGKILIIITMAGVMLHGLKRIFSRKKLKVN